MLDFTNLTKKRRPTLPWEEAKNKVLGKKYDLSIVLAGNALMRKLNKKHREKDKPANVLSFPLSITAGEIFINLFSLSSKINTLHLFIHSLLHLKGFKHSAKMEREEEKMLKKFNL